MYDNRHREEPRDMAISFLSAGRRHANPTCICLSRDTANQPCRFVIRAMPRYTRNAAHQPIALMWGFYFVILNASFMRLPRQPFRLPRNDIQCFFTTTIK